MAAASAWSCASFVVALAAALPTALACGCSSTSSSGGSTTCDPLAPGPITLGPLLGAGRDSQDTLYVADVAPGTDSGQDRVFVSSGHTLTRQHVAGTGQEGDPPNASYNLQFVPAPADSASLRSLVIVESGGAATQMSVGTSSGKSFQPGGEALTIEPSSAVAAFTVQDLPPVVQHVADVSNGKVIVIISPMDPWSTSGVRLFYGASGQMVEYTITSYNDDDYGTYIGFSVGGEALTATFAFVQGTDGGIGGGPGPGTLQSSGGTLSMTERTPVPQTLPGFAFVCAGS